MIGTIIGSRNFPASRQPRPARRQRPDRLVGQRGRCAVHRLRAGAAIAAWRRWHPGQHRARVWPDGRIPRGVGVLGFQLGRAGIRRGRCGLGLVVHWTRVWRTGTGCSAVDRLGRLAHRRQRDRRASVRRIFGRDRRDQAVAAARRDLAVRAARREWWQLRTAGAASDHHWQHRHCHRADLLRADRL